MSGEEFGEFPEPSEKEKIITVCGSTRFKAAWENVIKRLVEKGWFVRSVELFGHSDDIELSEEYKEYLDYVHKRKIDVSDAILVVNVNGYIGSSTKEEIRFAENMGKKIYYLKEEAE
jgi:hypothetical protein